MRPQATPLAIALLLTASIAVAQLYPPQAGAPAVAGPMATMLEAMRKAATPAAATTVYVNANAIDPKNIPLKTAYVQRMLELGLPEMARDAAVELIRLDPNASGIAWATVAYVAAMNNEMIQGLIAISGALALAPAEPFVAQTAGALYAWLDLQIPQPNLPEVVRNRLATLRKWLNTQAVFVTAYEQASRTLAADVAVPPAPAPAFVPEAPAVGGYYADDYGYDDGNGYGYRYGRYSPYVHVPFYTYRTFGHSGLRSTHSRSRVFSRLLAHSLHRRRLHHAATRGRRTHVGTSSRGFRVVRRKGGPQPRRRTSGVTSARSLGTRFTARTRSVRRTPVVRGTTRRRIPFGTRSILRPSHRRSTSSRSRGTSLRSRSLGSRSTSFRSRSLSGRSTSFRSRSLSSRSRFGTRSRTSSARRSFSSRGRSSSRSRSFSSRGRSSSGSRSFSSRGRSSSGSRSFSGGGRGRRR